MPFGKFHFELSQAHEIFTAETTVVSLMKAMIRINNLKLSGAGQKTLQSMELHGKRLDKTSKKRVVRDLPPLVHGTLDLRDAYEKHVDGCRMNKAVKTPVQHALIKFPSEYEPSEDNHRKMMKLAVDFINKVHGGNAVFAARIDRDEAGQHNVDVFFAPRYTKQTKNRKKEAVFTDWISTTKFGKELCEKHRDEIMSRNDEGKFSTTPRSTGIAMQAELNEYLVSKKIPLEARTIKTEILADRLETEAYKRVRDEEHRMKAELEIERTNLMLEKGKMVRLAERVLKAVNVLAERLNITLPAKLQDVVDDIEEAIDDLDRPGESADFSM